MLKKIALLALPGVAPFEFGVICEVFGIDRSAMGGPTFELVIATADPGPVRTSLGFTMDIRTGLDAVDDADLLAVPAHEITSIDERYLEVIRRAEARRAGRCASSAWWPCDRRGCPLRPARRRRCTR